MYGMTLSFYFCIILFFYIWTDGSVFNSSLIIQKCAINKFNETYVLVKSLSINSSLIIIFLLRHLAGMSKFQLQLSLLWKLLCNKTKKNIMERFESYHVSFPDKQALLMCATVAYTTFIKKNYLFFKENAHTQKFSSLKDV